MVTDDAKSYLESTLYNFFRKKVNTRVGYIPFSGHILESIFMLVIGFTIPTTVENIVEEVTEKVYGVSTINNLGDRTVKRFADSLANADTEKSIRTLFEEFRVREAEEYEEVLKKVIELGKFNAVGSDSYSLTQIQ